MIHTNYSTLDESFKQRYEASQQLVKEYQEQCSVDRFIEDVYATECCLFDYEASE
jgi:hypothetical protein